MELSRRGRWRKTGEAQYTGVVGRRVVSVRQTPSDVQFRVHNASSLPGATAAHHRAALGDYFALSTGLRGEWLRILPPCCVP
jgi:hypothetical protein